MENRGMFRRFNDVLSDLAGLGRKFAFKVLSVGPIPNHIAFIMDGNRRYARKHNLKGIDAGHRAGFVALTHLLRYCRELGLRTVSVFAFCMDNFRREPEEVKCLMDLMLEKIEFTIDQAVSGNLRGEKIIFIGNLPMLNERLRASAEKLMEITAQNTKMEVAVYVAYSSTHEIVRAVRQSCVKRCDRKGYHDGGDDDDDGGGDALEVSDLEECMYLCKTVEAEPEILIRTGGQNRMSDFMTWQTSRCLLSFMATLWPELGFPHLVWDILKFQRIHSYLQNKQKLD